MGRYIARRTVQGIVTVWPGTLCIFVLMRLSGDPVSYLVPPDASKENRARLIALDGLDAPLWQQYLHFNAHLLAGRFGPSLRWDSRDGMDVLLSRLPATLVLTGTAMLFSLVVGVTLGVLVATRTGSTLDRLGKGLAILGQSMLVFWVGILLILLFSVYLGWLPSAGGLDRLGLKGLILPALTLGWLFVASHMRLVRSSMLDALGSDYIKMAQVKGLPWCLVVWKHAPKNAAFPVCSLFAVQVTQLFSGAVVTETIFAWPGIGRLLVDSIFVRDYPVAQAVVFFAATFSVVLNTVVDMLYAWIDPRIRMSA